MEGKEERLGGLLTGVCDRSLKGRERQGTRTRKKGHEYSFPRPINYQKDDSDMETQEVTHNGISPPFPHLGSRIRHPMCDISDKAPDVSVLYQSSNPFRNIIQKPHGIAKKIH